MTTEYPLANNTVRCKARGFRTYLVRLVSAPDKSEHTVGTGATQINFYPVGFARFNLRSSLFQVMS